MMCDADGLNYSLGFYLVKKYLEKPDGYYRFLSQELGSFLWQGIAKVRYTYCKDIYKTVVEDWLDVRGRLYSGNHRKQEFKSGCGLS